MATLACTPANQAGPVKPLASATRKPTPRPGGSAGPGPVGPSGPVATPAAGLVDAAVAGRPLRRLPADAALAPIRLTGTLSLLTAGIISDNGGGLISDKGGGVISNQGGKIISDNGGGFIGKVRYGLAQAAPAAEARLADAVVLVEDAAGRVLADADGRPIAAVSDGQGGYVLDAALPNESLVLRAPLWQGGRLSAMLARDALAAGSAAGGALPLDLGTASSIAASYVIGEYVAPQADPQATYDKLPASEASRLARDLDAARGLLSAGPTYAEAELRGLGATLRAKDPAVDKTLADIRALLIGQANLGNGRPATEVPLFDVWSLAIDAQGRAYLGEHALGRVRVVGADGRLETLADAVSGRVRENVPGLSALLPLPDGGVLATGWALGQIWKLGQAAKAERIAGSGALERAAATGLAAAAAFLPQSLARLPDGTLIVGEAADDDLGDAVTAPRVLAIAPDGTLRQLPFGADWTRGRVAGVAAAADGAIWALHHSASTGGGRLYRLAPGAAQAALVAEGLGTSSRSGLAIGPDGRAHVCETEARRLVSFDAAGAMQVVAGPGAPAGAPAVEAPAGVAFGPDGALWLTDVGTTLVSARDAGGRWAVRAGTTRVVQRGPADAFALNFPGSVAFDAQGRMLIAEAGGHKIRRLEGDALTTVAGSFAGYAGDGGPAADARFDTPLWIRMHEGTLWVMDQANRRLRKIEPSGRISNVVGPTGTREKTVILPGKPQLATNTEVRWGAGIAFEPGTGRPYWASQFAGQVVRLTDKNRVELVAGEPRAEKNEIPGPAAWLAQVPVTGPAVDAPLVLPTGIAFDPTAAEPTLYVADLGHMRIVKVTQLASASPVCETFAGAPATEVLTRGTAAVIAEQGVPARGAAVVAPGGLCFDPAGNLYVGELGIRDLPRMAATFARAFPAIDALPAYTARIRKIARDGTITTIAGPGGRFFPDPTGEDALVLPLDLQIDPLGRLVIVDAGANLIRILPAGSF